MATYTIRMYRCGADAEEIDRRVIGEVVGYMEAAQWKRGYVSALCDHAGWKAPEGEQLIPQAFAQDPEGQWWVFGLELKEE